jgi:anti-sigma B factor antagonist
MKITVREAGNCYVLDCSGRIVLGEETRTLREAIREVSKEEPKKIVLNMRDVSYIDSTGIGELISGWAHMQKKESKLVLLNLSKKTRDLLILVKLYAVFEVFEDEKAALEGC